MWWLLYSAKVIRRNCQNDKTFRKYWEWRVKMFGQPGDKKTEMEKEENIRRKKIFSQWRRREGKGWKCLEKENIFSGRRGRDFFLSEVYLLSNLLGFVNDWEHTALWLLTSVLPKSKKEEKTQNYLNAVLSQVLHNSLIFVSNAIIKRIVTYTAIKSQMV